MKPFLAALLFVAAGLAGCAADMDAATTAPPARAPFDPTVLSPKRFDARPAEEAWVAAADGVQIHNAVFRPDTDGPVPVFINFSPYWGDTAMAGGDAFARYMVGEYVPRGFAVVLSAVRGTGHSGGCFQIAGDLELQDTNAVIDHFAKAPWSNGRVAAGGKSYDSTTQNGVVAKFPHPALKGIFHVSGITDMYRYNAKDGVAYVNGLSFTPRYFAMQGLDEYLGATNGAGAPGDETPESLLRLAADLACPELLGHLGSGTGSAADGMRDAYWEERNWNRHLPGSAWNGSVFFVHGLQDWNVKPDHVEPWLSILQQKGIPVLGWLHQDTANLGHVYPMRADWNETMLRWLDGTLKGIDTRLDELWGFEVAGTDGQWRRSREWPPAPAGEVVVGAAGAAASGPAGPAAARPVRVAGVPWATVTVTPAHPDDIARVVLYSESGGKRTFVTEAVRRLALTDDLGAPRPVTPGAPLTLNLTFFPIDHVQPAGATWVVELGGPPAAPATPPDLFWRPDQVTGVEYGAVEIHLPAASLDAMARQPVKAKCFTC